jgi:hypothetical protein
MRKVIILAIGALLLLSACDSSFSSAPVGETRTETIRVPATSAATDLTLRFGMADRFQLKGGAENLVDGSVQYNIDDLKPTVSAFGNRITIEQLHNGLTTFSRDVRNQWDLKLSDATPLALTIEAGAYNGDYDLGGLRLRELNISQGAAQTTYDFSKPNPESLERLTFSSGASTATLRNLANANAAALSFDGGAGTYALDFGGQLARSADVEITGGASTYTIRIPSRTPARVTVTGGMATINLAGFTRQGQQYINASWDESKPHLEITADIGLGTLNLESE